MKNKLTLLTAVILSSVTFGSQVHANEVENTVTATEQPSAVTLTETTNIEKPVVAPTETATEPTTITSTDTNSAESVEPTNNEINTQVTKTGTEIHIANPKVTIDQSEGQGKYNGFKVKYDDIHIPDEMNINADDKVIFTLPKEVKFQTSFEFDVKNPTNDVIGKAFANAETGQLTTIFNNYFTEHPLNKQMSLTFDAKWTDVVESGKPVSVNFNGTIITTNIAKEQEVGKDELVAKWGSQDKDDPTVINWTIRVNYANRVLNTVKLLDTMSDNQKLIDDYLEVNYVDKVDPVIYAGDARHLVTSMKTNPNGFELTLARLERMVYVNYKTRLTKAVKDSVNPTNVVKLIAGDTTATSSISVSLVGGKGNAIGENKPEITWELPHDAPVVDIPELPLEDIPLLPPSPVVDIPELPLEDIPLLPPSPVVDIPELPLEDIPLLPPAPVVDIPELPLEDIPLLPPAPVVEIPELPLEDIPLLPPAPVVDIPELPLEDIPLLPPAPVVDIPELPLEDIPLLPPAPVVEIPELPLEDIPLLPPAPLGEPTEPRKTTETTENHETPVKKTYDAPAMLPNTGESSSLVASLVGLTIAGTTLSFMYKKRD